MMKLNKMVFAFLIFAVFVTVLMVCCIEAFVKTEKPVRPTGHVSDDLDRIHVFHSGELRGVWVPYFSISDEKALDEAGFQSRFDSIIKTAKAHGANTLFVHVRSHCDAAYPSEIFPFADIYMKNGKAPDYDPLEIMVSSAHKAGLEFHAWINPYRISSSDHAPPESGIISEKIKSGSGCVIEYDGGLYLNPASSEARSLIIDGVSELVNNYSVDGVHLDDYFYAFTESEIDREDYEAYADSVSIKSKVLPLDKWRCANVSVLVSGINEAVKNIDESVLFGISPQGNIENDLSIGADVYTWCGENGYIDYIAPQIYYNSENPVCPFESTVDRWKSLVGKSGIKLYIGLALYKAGSDEDDGSWLESDDIIAKQIAYSRKAGTDGYILYSFDYLESEQTKAEISNIDRIAFLNV